MATNTITQIFPISKLASFGLPRVKFNWRVFLFLSFCSILLLSVMYIFQVNQIMKDGYSINNYQTNLDNLIKENKNLEVTLSQMSYMDKVQAKVQELGFQKVQTVEYIQISGSSLAKR
jgi:sensor histidine kinase regulating citrate/malate metabolism